MRVGNRQERPVARVLRGPLGVPSSAVERTQQMLPVSIVRKRSCGATALLVGVVALTAAAVSAQTPSGQIHGTVRGETGTPLEGVSVVAVGTPLGAVTRPDGRYVIPRVAPGTYQLRATRIGYTSREQPITVVGGEEASADFTLPSAAIALDQVVVVGYGTELRKDLTGSIGSVSSE